MPLAGCTGTSRPSTLARQSRVPGVGGDQHAAAPGVHAHTHVLPAGRQHPRGCGGGRGARGQPGVVLHHGLAQQRPAAAGQGRVDALLLAAGVAGAIGHPRAREGVQVLKHAPPAPVVAGRPVPGRHGGRRPTVHHVADRQQVQQVVGAPAARLGDHLQAEVPEEVPAHTRPHRAEALTLGQVLPARVQQPVALHRVGVQRGAEPGDPLVPSVGLKEADRALRRRVGAGLLDRGVVAASQRDTRSPSASTTAAAAITAAPAQRGRRQARAASSTARPANSTQRRPAASRAASGEVSSGPSSGKLPPSWPHALSAPRPPEHGGQRHHRGRRGADQEAAALHRIPPQRGIEPVAGQHRSRRTRPGR